MARAPGEIDHGAPVQVHLATPRPVPQEAPQP